MSNVLSVTHGHAFIVDPQNNNRAYIVADVTRRITPLLFIGLFTYILFVRVS